MDKLRGRIAAMFAMAACCVTAMAVALGVIAITSKVVIGGLAVAVAASCVLFMLVMMKGHGHRHDLPSQVFLDAVDTAPGAGTVTPMRR